MSLRVTSSQSVFVFFLLASVSFFLPMGEVAGKWLTYLFFFILLSAAVIQKKSINALDTYCIPFNFFLAIVLFSIVPAKIYWGQPYIVSIIAILPFLIYGLYGVLCKLNFSKAQVVNAICVLGKIYNILYIARTVLPFLPIGQVVEDSLRGNRLLLPGVFFCYFLYFQSLDRFLKHQSHKDGFWLFTSLLVIILPMTRQKILLTIILSFIMVCKRIRTKYLLAIIPALCLLLGIVLRTSVASNLVQMTSEQLTSENEYDNIRGIGMAYYFTEFPLKGVNYLIGNGIPSYGRSKYGNDAKEFAEDTKIYLIDIGFVGIYNYFGLAGLACYLWMVLCFMFGKCDDRFKWCRYLLMFILGSSVLSGVPLIPNQFIFICICAYLLTPYKNRIENGCKCNSGQLQYSAVDC